MTVNDVNKTVAAWIKQAEKNMDTANYLFLGKKYVDCLFFCHLSLEKMLKALVIKETGDYALPIHDLVRLAVAAGIEISGKEKSDLKTISEFNIAGRYDDEKMRFHKRCTRAYTLRYYELTKKYFIWLKEKISRHK